MIRLLRLLLLVLALPARAVEDPSWLAKSKAAAPVIADFAASAPSIVRGAFSSLSWIVTGAATCEIDQGVGAVDCAGPAVVSPAATTTYTLTATSAKGKTATASATVTLYPYRIPEGANLVAHVWWDGSSIQQTGSAFTMTGTVPQVAASGAVPAGSGPYSAANYYTAGNTLEQHGDVTVCAIVTLASHATEQTAVAKDAVTSNRNFLLENAGGTSGSRVYVFKSAVTYATAVTVGAATDARHLLCYSYDYVADGTSTLIVSLDGTQVSISNGAGPPATTTANLMIGRTDYATSPKPWLGYIHEVVLWSRALSAQDLTDVYTVVHAGGAV